MYGLIVCLVGLFIGGGAAAKNGKTENLYALLGVAQDASIGAITDAIIRVEKALPNDVAHWINNASKDPDGYLRQFYLAQKAREILLNREKRDLYDRQLGFLSEIEGVNPNSISKKVLLDSEIRTSEAIEQFKPNYDRPTVGNVQFVKALVDSASQDVTRLFFGPDRGRTGLVLGDAKAKLWFEYLEQHISASNFHPAKSAAGVKINWEVDALNIVSGFSEMLSWGLPTFESRYRPTVAKVLVALLGSAPNAVSFRKVFQSAVNQLPPTFFNMQAGSLLYEANKLYFASFPSTDGLSLIRDSLTDLTANSKVPSARLLQIYTLQGISVFQDSIARTLNGPSAAREILGTWVKFVSQILLAAKLADDAADVISNDPGASGIKNYIAQLTQPSAKALLVARSDVRALVEAAHKTNWLMESMQWLLQVPVRKIYGVSPCDFRAHFPATVVLDNAAEI